MKTILISVTLVLPFTILSPPLEAGSATWSPNPGTSDWNIATNWTPTTVPNGPSDTATFQASNIATLSLSAATEVDEVVFGNNAQAYSIIVPAALDLTLSGAGAANESGATQNFVAKKPLSAGGLGGNIQFLGDSQLGPDITLTAEGSLFFLTVGGLIEFFDNSSAGDGMIINEWGTQYQSRTAFYDNAAAGNAIIINEGDPTGHLNARGGEIFFTGGASAGSATIMNNGGSQSNSIGGYVQFTGTATAASCTLTNGPSIDEGGPSETFFMESSSAGAATLIADGGVIVFADDTSGGTAQFQLSNGGLLTLASHVQPGMEIGSVEGDSGGIVLGEINLVIGTNGLSTSFGGRIADFLNNTRGHGSITKTGTGTLTLTGPNIYTAGTTILQGALVVSNPTGSGTGTGDVQVDNGILGGSGTIAGGVTLTGNGATLAPAAGTNTPAELTIQKSLTFDAGAAYTYIFKANSNRARTDLVTANGVSINDAMFKLRARIRAFLPQGLVLTVINNTSTDPISGTFSNLPDGAIVRVSGNSFQASYHGGDGNDLTLTLQ